MGIMVLIPIIIWFILYKNYYHLKHVYSLLVQVVNNPYEYHLTSFERTREPMINLDKIKIPEFLSVKRNFKNDNLNDLKNRQDLLFWFSSANFHARLLHITYIIQIIWLISFMLKITKDSYIYVVLTFSIAFIIVNVFYLLPKNIYYLTITSHIQFYKNRKMVQEVVMEQKRASNNLFRKMYRINKSDLKILEDNKSRMIPLQDSVKDQIQKSFELLSVV